MHVVANRRIHAACRLQAQAVSRCMHHGTRNSSNKCRRSMERQCATLTRQRASCYKRINVVVRSNGEASSAGSTASELLWRSHVSKARGIGFAIDECVQSIMSAAGPSPPAPDLAIVFISSAYSNQYDEVCQYLVKRVPSLKFIVGSSVRAIVTAIVRESSLQLLSQQRRITAL